MLILLPRCEEQWSRTGWAPCFPKMKREMWRRSWTWSAKTGTEWMVLRRPSCHQCEQKNMIEISPLPLAMGGESVALPKKLMLSTEMWNSVAWAVHTYMVDTRRFPKAKEHSRVTNQQMSHFILQSCQLVSQSQQRLTFLDGQSGVKLTFGWCL